MFKAIVCGDLHYRGINPRSRLDNFQEALGKKLVEVFGMALQHQAQAIIIPGDIFDSPNTAWGTAAELAKMLQAAPCPVLTIAGNHDIWAGNPGSKHRTPFGFMAALGIVWDLGESPYQSSTREKSMLDICISGHGFDIETDTAAGAGQFTPRVGSQSSLEPEDWDGVMIHVVHSMLMDREPGFDMRHTLISQVQTTAQVVVSGHEHTGFGIFRRNDGVLFINPGALCRLTAHVAEIERTVQVALLTVQDGRADAELIPLTTARPGHEVLSREHLDDAAERESRLNDFLALLASEGEAKFLEVREIVEDITARDNIPEEVKAEALKRIGAAWERLGAVAAKSGNGEAS